MDALNERLDRGEVIILDGATGTELERRGVPMHERAWSAAALETHPEVVRQAHEDYIHAGADIIITNTFSTGRHVLKQTHMGGMVRELNAKAVTLAREAREAASGRDAVYIAGSISTAFQPSGPRSLSVEQVKASYREQAEILAEAGVDLLMMEMMTNAEQAAYAIEAAVSTGLPTWIGYSCTTRDDSEVVLLHGEGETFAQAMESLMSLGGALVSIMHTEVEDTAPALRVVQERWHRPLGAYAHSGTFRMPHWQFDNIISPRDYLAETKTWVEMGVQLIGGCCGIGPEHIRVLKDRLPPRIPER